MDVKLKQLENKVGLYIDKKLVTFLFSKNIKQATDWVEKNLAGVIIHITK